MSTVLGTVVVIAAVLLLAGAALAVVRIERGPSMLDRTIGLDVLTTTIVGAGALEAAWSRRAEMLPILVVLSLVGFVGSVVVARFAAVEPEGEALVRTPRALREDGDDDVDDAPAVEPRADREGADE
ncbi:monovalent cation/H+ antiporter complex subunit F [Antribacter gilvus]|uniref:monovalent cation/H+ antiporter complex subunit F n=1 Tax=Antribacter gilvus TaxID=2304675 RepID=UPI000F76D6FA|nr:monovalent cation/H+ antiporter complex subunit F [Antribacter gilvus]